MYAVISLALVFSCAVQKNPRNPFDQGTDAFNLGPIGAEGNPKDKNKIDVAAVTKDGPADKGGLLKGDLIVGIDGKGFAADKHPVFQLVEALEAVTMRKAATCVLAVERGGKPAQVKLTLPSLGPHSKGCPKSCKRCDAMAKQSLDWLVKQQEPDGGFPTMMAATTGKVVVTSVCGMAFMANGGYKEPLAKCADYVMKNAVEKAGANGDDPFKGLTGGKNWNQSNWALGYGGVFLGLVYQQTKDAKVKESLAAIAAQIVKNQEATGGWAHGPGGPNALDYLELEIMSNWVLAALGLAQQAGVDVRADAIEKGMKYVELCAAGDGGVGYADRPGQKGMGEPGRTSGAIFAWMCLRQAKGGFYGKMTQYWERNMADITNGHVSPVMHYSTSGLAAHALGAGPWDKFMDRFRIEFLACRRVDGSFAARPTEESEMMHSNSDRSVGDCWITGNYLLILGLPNKNLKY